MESHLCHFWLTYNSLPLPHPDTADETTSPSGPSSFFSFPPVLPLPRSFYGSLELFILKKKQANPNPLYLYIFNLSQDMSWMAVLFCLNSNLTSKGGQFSHADFSSRNFAFPPVCQHKHSALVAGLASSWLPTATYYLSHIYFHSRSPLVLSSCCGFTSIYLEPAAFIF